jgi:hypothetical protein
LFLQASILNDIFIICCFLIFITFVSSSVCFISGVSVKILDLPHFFPQYLSAFLGAAFGNGLTYTRITASGGNVGGLEDL